MQNFPKYIIGIDEAGRGPLAGPVSVGVTCVPVDFNWEHIAGVGDSKKVSPKNREAIFSRAQELKKAGVLTYAVAMISAETIDKIGIVLAITKAMDSALTKIHRSGLCKPEDCFVKLDGGLKAPERFKFQETIIKGDQKEKVIGLASILAKVTRDRHMQKLALKKEYALYSFDIHKGYGTKMHRKSIAAHGISDMHRKSFCKNCFDTLSVV